MNELAKHIEYLLLSHNYVIVPSLGIFRSMHTPAQWVENESLFIPPVRNVHFDSSITIDPDAIFLQSLAEIYNLTPDEAVKRCEDMVAEFHRILVTEGSIDFGSIGVFTLEDDAEICMASCECGVLTPSYYGLDALHFKKLYQAETTKAEPEPFVTVHRASELELTNETVLEDKEEKKTDDGSKTIVIEAASTQQTNTAEEKTEKKSSNVAFVVGKDSVITPSYTDDEDKHYVLRINKSIFKYACTFIIAMSLFFICRPTAVNHDTITRADYGKMFLHPNMIQSDTESTDYLAIPTDETDTANYDGVLIDVTDEARNEGYDFSSMPTQSAFPSLLTLSLPDVRKSEKASNSTQAESVVKMLQEAVMNSKNKKEVVAANKTATAQTAKVRETETKKDVTEVVSPTNSYCIVLASQVSKVNANSFADKMQKKNVNAKVIEGKVRRVVVDGFATSEAAHNALDNIKIQHPELNTAWVLKL